MIVTAPRKEAVAREVQRNAVNIVNVQSAETILKYPDFNAAEALGRMPGVSISTDTGEGRFVNIRGIDGNLAGATFGGVPLLNTNPGGTYFGGGGRAVEFDTVPTGSIDGLIVYKTTLPDHEAEGLGGSVEITPRTATHITKPFLDATLGWGYEPAHDHTGPFNAELALGARFGFGPSGLVVEGDGRPQGAPSGWITNPTPFSFVLTASRRDDRRGFDDIEADPNDTTVDRAYQDYQMRRYDYHRRRFGYGGEFDFQPNDDHSYFIRANVAGYKESVKKNRLTYDDLGTDYIPVDPAEPKWLRDHHRHQPRQHRRGGDPPQPGLCHWRSGPLRRGGARLSRLLQPRDLLRRQELRRQVQGAAGPAVHLRQHGQRRRLPGAGRRYVHRQRPGELQGDHLGQQQHRARRRHRVGLRGEPAVPGPSVRRRQGQDRDRGPPARQDRDALYLRLRPRNSPPSLAAASSPAITDFYGRYTNGPNVNTDAVRAAALAGTLTDSGVDQSGVFTARENIYAGYGQYETTIGKWSLLAGVRVEATAARAAMAGSYSRPPTTVRAPTLAFVRPESDNYTDVFPTVQLRYQVTNDFQVRATYSTGIGRPGFLQNTAATSSNHDVTDPQITQGNPDLHPTTGNNFDLSLEFYLPKGGILQFGVFDKEFSNYIVTLQQTRLDTDPTSEFNGDLVKYTTFGNRSGAYARGLEVAYHQQFVWLPGIFKGFGVDANATLVTSHIEEYDAATSALGIAESGLLPGTSQVTWNLAGFYEAYGLFTTAGFAAEFVGHSLYGLGGDRSLDTIQDTRLLVDFTSAYQITPNWAVYFNAKNLTNDPLRFYQNNPSFPIQREYYDQTYEAGIRARF